MPAWFETLDLASAIGIFGVAAALILVFGAKLERWADAIGARTRLGDVFAGMILLAISTSLPEIATSLTATLRGEVDLAVNNLLGGVIVQTMVLAVADAVGTRAALTRNVPSFGLLIQGVGLILVLATAGTAVVLESHFGDIAWMPKLGPMLVLLVYLGMQYLAMRARQRSGWRPVDRDEGAADNAHEEQARSEETRSLRRLVLLYVAGSAVVCAGGYAVVLSTERIAAITSSSRGFLGFTIVAFATSLPEVATTFAAARRGRPVTAASNIFGSNGFDVALLALVAALATGPIFSEALLPSLFAATLGVVLTAIYLIGMLERRDRAVLRMGWDSIAVLVLGTLGIGVVYALGASR